MLVIDPAPSAIQNETISATKDDAQLLSSLITIAKLVRVLNGYHLSKIGLAMGQDDLLDALATHGPLSVSRVAELLTVRSSTVSKMVTLMSTAGYLTKSSARNDLRTTILALTAAGIRKHDELMTVRHQIESDLQRQAGGIDLMSCDIPTVSEHLRMRMRRFR